MFTAELAGVAVAIDNRFDFVYRQCREYLTSRAPEFTVSVSDEERIHEQQTSTEEVKRMVKDFDGYAESVCVYREICRKMPEYGAFLFHSAALAYKGGGYLFSAPSGTGKTTHLRLWKRAFAGRVEIVNGDKPLVRLEDGVFKVCGTPWSGKEGWQKNMSVPVKGVCLLARGGENRIVPLSKEEAAQAVFSQLVYPRERAALLQMLTLVDGFVKSVPFYRLFCTVSQEAALLSFETMTGEKPPVKEEE